MGVCTISTPADANNNATDFYLSTPMARQPAPDRRLGAPGPQNLASPVNATARLFRILDATAAVGSAPNRVRDFTSDPANNSTFGTLSFAEDSSTSTGANVTRLRFRVIDLTTFPAPSWFSPT